MMIQLVDFAIHLFAFGLLVAVALIVIKSLEFWSRLLLDSKMMMSSKYRVYSLSYFLITSSPYIDEGIEFKTTFIRLWNSVLLLSAMIAVLLVYRVDF